MYFLFSYANFNFLGREYASPHLYIPSLGDAIQSPIMNVTLEPPLEQSPPAGQAMQAGPAPMGPARGAIEYLPRVQKEHTPMPENCC